MKDSDTGSKSSSPRKGAHKHGWSRVVAKVKRELHERKTRKKDESPADRAAKRTATATVWIAVFTVILACVGGFTLYEVIEGGRIGCRTLRTE